MQLLAMNGWWRRAAEKLALCCLLFVVILRCEAQNLVPNGSFELADTCPYTAGFQEGDQPLYWRKWLNSPDYFSACADTATQGGAYISVPQNGLAYQYAQDGDAYVGYYAYDINGQYREYIGTPLIAPLTVGATYYLSFWANIATGGVDGYVGGLCNNMGLLFTMHSNVWVDFDGPAFPFRNYAHLYRAEVLTDTANWTLVSGSFVADSAYQYVVLGNFFDNDNTQVMPIPPLNGENAYCLVDNVCVSPNSNGCDRTGIGEIHQPGEPTAFVDVAIGELMVIWPGHARFRGEVVDPAGRQVCRGGSVAEELRLSLAGLSAGLYIARLRQEGEYAFVKFVLPR